MTHYRKINNVAGWLVFAFSLTVYLFTMEPTVSLWDCGEFTAAAYKLEVGHPPGAPLYLMLARIFSLFAIDRSHIAICINSLSAISSAFTVLFLFWTITHLLRRLILRSGMQIENPVTSIIACGAIGALAFTFSDSFWFSAVEAEVYALSSLFTALVFWAALKWEEDTGPHRNRWLVLIAYLIGLSIGVHLLNLLAVPVIVMIVYFKSRRFSWKRLFYAFVFSAVILFSLLYILIPGTVRIAAVLELVSVNDLKLPVNSGLIIFLITAITVLFAFLRLSFKHGAVWLNTSILCVMVTLVGYSSYAMILIRAQANTPVNTGDPSDAFSLISYLNRTQYGNRPLGYGPYYNAPKTVVDADDDNYVLRDGQYVKTLPRKSYAYDSRFKTFFPRMYSSNPDHVQVYKDWGAITGKAVEVRNTDGSSYVIMKPTFRENIQFFLSYQLGYMYFRYFLWNFAGKQNDMQGNGGILKGNWISGFDFIDRFFIGSQQMLPEYLKNNTGRTRYFLLPLLLGIVGIVYHFRRSRKYAGLLLLLFFMTGIAIAVYTNPTPLQPRERDYVYVGSFYVFSIWLGMGVLAIIQFLRKFLKRQAALATGIIFSVSVPLLMFSQNIEGHNRHGRYAARDIAFNYLNSCDKNAVLFTFGDNDTFPLWYLQEVEGIRTDVRVVNLSLLNASWYAEQLKRKVYDSEAIPCRISYSSLYFPAWIKVNSMSEKIISGEKAVGIIAGDTLRNEDIAFEDELPSKNIFLKVNPKDSVNFSLPGNYLSGSQMATLDVITAVARHRPVYFTAVSEKETLGLRNYLRLEGYAYRLTSCKKDTTQDQWDGSIDTRILYDKLICETSWNGYTHQQVLMDDHVRNMFNIMHVRLSFVRLALKLGEEGKSSEGLKVLDKLTEMMPFSVFGYDYNCIYIAQAYYKCGNLSRGDSVSSGYVTQLKEEQRFFNQLMDYQKSWVATDKANSVYCMQKLSEMLRLNKRDKVLNEFNL